MLMVIDYGVGNVGSIRNMIRYLGGEAISTKDPAELEGASGIILPGVGKFGRGMKHLREGGWIDALNRCVIERQIPILGICLGMQLMTRGSEESPGVEGLGWLAADTVRFQFEAEDRLRVPHMGWNIVKPSKNSRLLDDDGEEKRFYFVHSYHVVCDQDEDVAGTTFYVRRFISAIQRGNLFGFQPHPEKSHRFGMDVFRKFIAMSDPTC